MRCVTEIPGVRATGDLIAGHPQIDHGALTIVLVVAVLPAFLTIVVSHQAVVVGVAGLHADRVTAVMRAVAGVVREVVVRCVMITGNAPATGLANDVTVGLHRLTSDVDAVHGYAAHAARTDPFDDVIEHLDLIITPVSFTLDAGAATVWATTAERDIGYMGVLNNAAFAAVVDTDVPGRGTTIHGYAVNDDVIP